MRFRYKTSIVIISMCILFIGLLTFSLGGTSKDNSKDKGKNEDRETIAHIDDKETNEPEKWSSSEEIEVNTYPEINKLIEDYLLARVEGNEEKLKELISGTNTLDLEQFRKKSEHIEGYDNIECYTLKSPEEGIYLVYVYEEVKIVGIDTLAPSMIRLLVSIAEDGKPYVYFGTISDNIINFMNKMAESDNVKELTAKVNLKLEEAEAKDTNLKKFNENLKAAAQLAEEKAKASDEIKQTVEPSKKPE